MVENHVVVECFLMSISTSQFGPEVHTFLHVLVASGGSGETAPAPAPISQSILVVHSPVRKPSGSVRLIFNSTSSLPLSQLEALARHEAL